MKGGELEAATALAAFVAEVRNGERPPTRADRHLLVGQLLDEHLHYLEHDRGRKHDAGPLPRAREDMGDSDDR